MPSYFVAFTFESGEALLEFESLCSIFSLSADVKFGGLTVAELQKCPVSKGVLVPTIIITAFSEERYHQTTIDTGAADYLLNPIPTERLLSAVNGALRRH